MLAIAGDCPTAEKTSDAGLALLEQACLGASFAKERKAMRRTSSIAAFVMLVMVLSFAAGCQPESTTDSATVERPAVPRQAETATDSATVEEPAVTKASLPSFTGQLAGANEVRVRNPNDFSVMVGVRCGGNGKDFQVAPTGRSSVFVPDGKYDIFFVYSDKPEALFQGDSFTLADNGVEIQIVKVVDGNYNIRQVR